jgi:hypothetical protein
MLANTEKKGEPMKLLLVASVLGLTTVAAYAPIAHFAERVATRIT